MRLFLYFSFLVISISSLFAQTQITNVTVVDVENQKLIPTATHTIDDVNETLDAFDAIRTRLENGTYKRLSAALMSAMGG